MTRSIDPARLGLDEAPELASPAFVSRPLPAGRQKLQLPYDLRFLRLLKLSPFERRPRGGWRFGTKTISTAIVDRLIASGRAEVIGDRLQLKTLEAAE